MFCAVSLSGQVTRYKKEDDFLATISLCMIVKNEENTLAKCLRSIQNAVDEIIIVDTGSTDNTKKIAREFTDKVFDFEWINDFSAARNYAYSKGTKDYLMWLDADDVVAKIECKKIIKLKKELSDDTDMVTMKYNIYFDEDGNPTITSLRERLTRREKGYLWIDPVHECIPLSGKIYNADISIDHRKEKQEEVSTRNLDIYFALEKSKKEFSPRQLYYFARELKDHQQYKKAIEYYNRFLDSKRGWAEDNINACRDLAVCYQKQGQEEQTLKLLLQSFEYDSPRAEVLCDIAYQYKNKGDYGRALKWFEIAANVKKPETFCFMSADYWNYIPYLEQCVCYSNLGNTEKAIEYNEKAAEYKPNSLAVKLNREYFSGLKH